MATHGWIVMPRAGHTAGDATVAVAGVESTGAVSTGILVEAREASLGGGCGSSGAGAFGGGALLALPLLLVAAALRRRARR